MTILNAVELTEISKVYRLGEVDVSALHNINLRITEKSFTAIDGPSGSGKTTLLNIVGFTALFLIPMPVWPSIFTSFAVLMSIIISLFATCLISTYPAYQMMRRPPTETL